MSYSKDRKRNEYVVRVSYKRPDGKYAQISKRVKKYADIAEAEHELRLRLEVSKPQSVKLEKLITDYLKFKGETRKASTQNEKEIKCRKYVIAFFGKDRCVSSIDRSLLRQWKEFINSQKSFRSGLPLSLGYKNDCYHCLSDLLKYARREYGISAPSLELLNLGGFIRNPNSVIKKKEIRYWTLSQFLEMDSQLCKEIEECKDGESLYRLKTMRVMFNVLMFAGLRKGEANALQVSDFHNGDIPYLDITKSLSQKINNLKQTGKWTMTPPKTASSVRTVHIPSQLATLLKEHIDGFLPTIDESYGPCTFLVGGYRPVPDSNLDKKLKEETKKLGLPSISIHELRHSYATYLANSGVGIQIISRLLGHSSIEETWKTYSHLYPNTNAEAVRMFSEGIEKVKFSTN